jgi:hypothetical protein
VTEREEATLAGMGRGLTVVIAVLVVILLIVLAIPFIV